MLPVRRNRSLGKQRKPQPSASGTKLTEKPATKKAVRPKTHGQPSQAVDWQQILDDVNFIRGKLDEAEQSKQDVQPDAAMQQLLYHTEFLYGQPQSIESMHRLYQQVLQLHRANSILREEVNTLTKELQQSRQKLYQSELTNSILREENKRIQNEFVRKVEVKAPLPLYCTTKKEQKELQATTAAHNSHRNTASTRFTQQPLNLRNRTVILPPATPLGFNSGVTPKQEAVEILNEQFEHLFQQSRSSRSSSMRNHLRRQLYGISEQIKRLSVPSLVS